MKKILQHTRIEKLKTSSKISKNLVEIHEVRYTNFTESISTRSGKNPLGVRFSTEENCRGLTEYEIKQSTSKAHGPLFPMYNIAIGNSIWSK